MAALAAAFAAVFCVAAAACADAATPEPAPAAGAGVPASVAVLSTPPDQAIGPRILGGFDARTRSRLAVSFRLAVGRLETLPACAQLFAELGFDGIARLRAVRYQSVSDVGGDRVCGRGLGAAAFTTVGNLRTIVCPGFDRLGVDEAAVIVLHEALHSAGRTEWPLDPSAPNGGQINRLIRLACNL